MATHCSARMRATPGTEGVPAAAAAGLKMLSALRRGALLIVVQHGSQVRSPSPQPACSVSRLDGRKADEADVSEDADAKVLQDARRSSFRPCRQEVLHTHSDAAPACNSGKFSC